MIIDYTMDKKRSHFIFNVTITLKYKENVKNEKFQSIGDYLH